MDPSRAKTRNPDAWLAGAPEFSRAVAEQLREWFLDWQPDLTESVKWNNLCYSGRRMVVGISACQKHLGIFFFRGRELADPQRLFNQGLENNTSLLSIRLTGLEDFPREALRGLLHRAVLLDDGDVPPTPARKRDPWPMPDFFAEALKKDRLAAKGFESFAPTYQREYLVWLTSAKRPETREQRLRNTLAALREGKKWAQRKA